MTRRFLLLTACWLIAAPPTSAAPAVTLAPHRAIYDMKLGHVQANSNVIAAEGRMLFALRDSCDGWAVEQKMDMRYAYAQGNRAHNKSTLSSWESKDGKHFTFASRSTSNGKETSIFRGEASLSPHGGEVRYSLPEPMTRQLAGGTIFPNGHTIELLHHAATATAMPLRTVFDGSDEAGQSDVSVHISKPVALTASDLDAKLRDNPLLAAPAWPVRLAFFAADTETTEVTTPDYELTLDMTPNGITRSLVIDYGDFAVRGHLVAIEPIPAPRCAP